MSNYTRAAINPDTGKAEVAHFIDDYFGRYIYGVRFSDGSVHKESDVGFEYEAWDKADDKTIIEMIATQIPSFQLKAIEKVVKNPVSRTALLTAMKDSLTAS